MVRLREVHHIALICSNYERSKDFYCRVLGFTLLSEVYRQERGSWKGDLALNGNYQLELFSFPASPARVSGPESCGLRHLAFAVDDLQQTIDELAALGVACETVRVDPYTQKRFTFFNDPDGLPLELYES